VKVGGVMEKNIFGEEIQKSELQKISRKEKGSVERGQPVEDRKPSGKFQA